ncbi:MAG TPA: hypothetical protein PLD74_06440 [Prolixibacteraceae bacterium]|nr:hypothetical protein [Prolixibacteraceae bacterium]HOS00245.1 hypothetical protein [Prolixibacteraceae bacterium]HOS89265.1 hypothetical protein [Prolixibacteraceae bacterium]HPL45684.1 hypothetical protein [Prolixibacteraceae bacterium]HPV18313.1 hypothetical protein [Prolixibacteraceae bacterium]
MDYFLYAAAFFLGVAFMYLITRQVIRIYLNDEMRAYRREIRKKRKWWKPVLFPEVKVLKRHKDHYKREVEKLQGQLEEEAWQLDQHKQSGLDLLRKVEELRRENQELKIIVASPAGLKNRVPGTRGASDIRKGDAAPSDDTVTLYFGIPDHQGHFPADRSEPEYDNRKLFMVVTKKDSDRGELHYLSGDLDLKAINNVDYYLLPVCEISNIAGRNSANRVVQDEKGMVALVSGKWICNKKIRVKLV